MRTLNGCWNVRLQIEFWKFAPEDSAYRLDQLDQQKESPMGGICFPRISFTNKKAHLFTGSKNSFCFFETQFNLKIKNFNP